MAIDPTAATAVETRFWRSGNDEVGSFEDVKPVEGGFSFDDLVDFINPLHHIPVVSEIYREMTGDTIRPHVQAAASAVFGPVSLVSGVAKAMISAETSHQSQVAAAATAPDERASTRSTPAGVPAGDAASSRPSDPMLSDPMLSDPMLSDPMLSEPMHSEPMPVESRPSVQVADGREQDVLPEDLSPVEDLILRGLLKYDAMRSQVG